MKITLIFIVVASLCVGGAAGAGVARALLKEPACQAQDSSWQKFINVPPQTDAGTTYK
jgi:hypothetical protein